MSRVETLMAVGCEGCVIAGIFHASCIGLTRFSSSRPARRVDAFLSPQSSYISHGASDLSRTLCASTLRSRVSIIALPEHDGSRDNADARRLTGSAQLLNARGSEEQATTISEAH